jgi:hypothetical protein
MDRQKRINRTRTGVLLLLIGSLLSWIPIAQIIGALLLLIGAILVILGRKAFGPMHSRFVVISILVFIVGFVITIVGGFILGFTLASAYIGGAPTPAALQSAFINSLIIAFAGTAIAGIASVLFTFGLQNQMGRILLMAGYAASIAVQAIIFVIVSALVASTVAAMFPGGTYNQTAAIAASTAFQNQAAVWGYLSAIPALIFAGADYIAWTRIKKGEIPAPMAPPSMAAPLPPR